MNKDTLEKKLKEINATIKDQLSNQKKIGVFDGLAGISLFKFYYSKYLNIDDHGDMGVAILTDCINTIIDGYSEPSFCSGIAGSAWVMVHLEQEEFINTDNDELLVDLDEYLYQNMISDMKAGNYDLLYGANGYALFFINRYKNTNSKKLKSKYKGFLLEFIELLNKMAEADTDKSIKWISVLDPSTKAKGYNLGLSHGISSIIGILSRLHKYDDFKVQTKTLLTGAINYIISQENKSPSSSSLFPSWVAKEEKNTKPSRLAWCYGDLGIGIQLWTASRVLGDLSLEKIAIRILKHAATRKTLQQTKVKDPGVCHGAFGNALIFQKIFQETQISVFKDAHEYWIDEGMKMAIHDKGHAGFCQWKGSNGWVPEISLLEGVAGIGLSIINYLADFESNWDECLLIS